MYPFVTGHPFVTGFASQRSVFNRVQRRRDLFSSVKLTRPLALAYRDAELVFMDRP